MPKNIKTTSNYNELRLIKSWRWIMTIGIMFIVLGIIGLGAATTLTLVSVLFFGWLLIIGGIFQLFQSFKGKGTDSFTWHFVIAILYLFAGGVVVYDPVGSAIALTVFIAFILFGIGFIRVILAIQLKSVLGWWWPLAGGVGSIILGAIILLQWPLSALWVIGVFIAIDMILNGWTYVMIAIMVRRTSLNIPI